MGVALLPISGLVAYRESHPFLLLPVPENSKNG